jgi:hypothetical protein
LTDFPEKDGWRTFHQEAEVPVFGCRGGQTFQKTGVLGKVDRRF